MQGIAERLMQFTCWSHPGWAQMPKTNSQDRGDTSDHQAFSEQGAGNWGRKMSLQHCLCLSTAVQRTRYLVRRGDKPNRKEKYNLTSPEVLLTFQKQLSVSPASQRCCPEPHTATAHKDTMHLPSCCLQGVIPQAFLTNVKGFAHW